MKLWVATLLWVLIIVLVVWVEHAKADDRQTETCKDACEKACPACTVERVFDWCYCTPQPIAIKLE